MSAVNRWRASVDVPATLRGPATARALVAALLRAWGLEPLIDTVQLVTSELVTNAVQYAPGTETLDLEVSVDDHRVRVSLADESAVRPTLVQLDELQPRGRGLHIVQAVAERWGTLEKDGGKRVWADIAIPPGG